MRRKLCSGGRVRGGKGGSGLDMGGSKLIPSFDSTYAFFYVAVRRSSLSASPARNLLLAVGS